MNDDVIRSICASFLLPRHIIEWSPQVDDYFFGARRVGISRARAQKVLDEEMARSRESLLITSWHALSAAKERLIDEATASIDEWSNK